MNLSEFQALHSERVRGCAKRFELIAPDKAATEVDIDRLEREMGVRLPVSYREFLAAFGGGVFGAVQVFSADPLSDLYLISNVNQMRAYLPPSLIPFSDDQAGGVYGFQMERGLVSDAVLYWSTDGGVIATKYSDLFEFVADRAYA